MLGQELTTALTRQYPDEDATAAGSISCTR